MRLGVRHTALGADTLENAFQRAAELGVEGLEIVYSQPADAAALGQGDYAKELASLSENYEVAVASLDLAFLCTEPSLIREANIPRAQEMVRRALSTAAAVAAGTVLVPFFGKNVVQSEPELQTACDALRDLVDLAAAAGAVLAVESTLNIHQDLFLLDCLGDTPDTGVYFNTAVALARKLDAATMLRDLGRQRVAQVHFQDVRLAPAQPPDYHVPLGQGHVDFRAVKQSLHAIGYDGWVVPLPPLLDNPLAGTKADLVFTRGVLGA